LEGRDFPKTGLPLKRGKSTEFPPGKGGKNTFFGRGRVPPETGQAAGVETKGEGKGESCPPLVMLKRGGR